MTQALSTVNMSALTTPCFAIYDPTTHKYWNDTKQTWVNASKGGKLKAAVENDNYDAAVGSLYTTLYDFSLINSSAAVKQYIAMFTSGGTTLMHSFMVCVASGQLVDKMDLAN